jgi:hypothetical protein
VLKILYLSTTRHDQATNWVLPLYELHIALNVTITPNPRFVADEDSGAGSAYQDPEALHVSLAHKQPKHGGNIVRAWGCQIVVSLADQLFATIPQQSAKAIRHFNISSVTIYDGGVISPHGTTLLHPFVAEGQSDTQLVGSLVFRLVARLRGEISVPDHRAVAFCSP